MQRSASLPLLALMLLIGALSFSATVSEAQNLDPSCILQAKKAGPCVNKVFGPKYNAKCTTNPKDGPLQYEGYLGAPCKEKDGTAFTVPGKCIPGNMCFCIDCKAEGDKGGMMPMMPMLPMSMPMPGMEMPQQPCTPSSTLGTTTARDDCLCQQNPYATGCQSSAISDFLNSFSSDGDAFDVSDYLGGADESGDWGGTGSALQNAAFGALDALGGIANSVSGSVLDTAATAIEKATGVQFKTDFSTSGVGDSESDTIIVESIPDGSVPGGTNTAYAQAAYTDENGSKAIPLPQYAYDSDTTQYGAFGGEEEDLSFLAALLKALAGALSQLSAAIGTLFGIL